MRKRSLYPVIVFGAIAILAAFALQGYYLWSAYRLKDQEFAHQVQLALLRVAEGFEELNQTPVPDVALINRITSNYYVVNLNAVIDAGDLEFLLQRELEQAGLRENFEYGIYDCFDDRMVYGKLISYAPPTDTMGYQAGRTPDLRRVHLLLRRAFPGAPRHDAGEHRDRRRARGRAPHHDRVLRLRVVGADPTAAPPEMQKDFINNMTHEFKTPLSTIKVASGVLARAPTVQADTRLARYAEIVESQNERLTSQVEKVLAGGEVSSEAASSCSASRPTSTTSSSRPSTGRVPRSRRPPAPSRSTWRPRTAPCSPTDSTSPARSRPCSTTPSSTPPARRTSRSRRAPPRGHPHHRRRPRRRDPRGAPRQGVREVLPRAHGRRPRRQRLRPRTFLRRWRERGPRVYLSLDTEREVGAAFQLDLPYRDRAEPFWRKLKRSHLRHDKQPEWTQA